MRDTFDEREEKGQVMCSNKGIQRSNYIRILSDASDFLTSAQDTDYTTMCMRPISRCFFSIAGLQNFASE